MLDSFALSVGVWRTYNLYLLFTKTLVTMCNARCEVIYLSIDRSFSV